VHHEWVPTEESTPDSRVAGFDALWCVPASPYRSTEGALRPIRFAREHNVPFLGTCGGFQHAVLEYARNALGWTDASHAELTPGVGRHVISPLECSPVEVSGAVRYAPVQRMRTVISVRWSSTDIRSSWRRCSNRSERHSMAECRRSSRHSCTR